MSIAAAFDRHPELEFHSIAVRRAGQPILERTWGPYRPDDLVLVYSASKTFTATAVGLAIAEGYFALTDRVVDLLAVAPNAVDPRVGQITVHHLLSMSTGHDVDTLEAAIDAPADQWVARILSLPPAHEVGSRHVYNNGASFLLGELVRQCTGQDLLEFLQPRVLDPLEIAAIWERDPLGRCLGWSGLHVTTAGLAAIGELYRCDGVWNGQRLLPEGWVQQATTKHIATLGEDEAKPEWRLGYGYQLWLGREGYRLDGAYGQYSLVIPERELVIAITSAQGKSQAMMDFVFDELLSLLPDEPVALPAADISGPTDTGAGVSWTAAVVSLDAALAVDPEIEQLHVPSLSDLSVHRSTAGFAVAMAVDAETTQCVAGAGQWVRQSATISGSDVPVAVSAGATADNAVVLSIAFTDTPHVLDLRVDAAGRAGMAWRTAPLHTGHLSKLRAGASAF